MLKRNSKRTYIFSSTHNFHFMARKHAKFQIIPIEDEGGMTDTIFENENLLVQRSVTSSNQTLVEPVI